jgi:GntR family transcriptional regulator
MLRSEIMHAEFPKGRLPGEAELMVAYAVPRAVVREALAMLRAESLIDRLQGSGTMVVTSPVISDFDAAHHSDAPDGPVFDPFSEPIVHDRSEVPTPPVVARRLGARVGDPCLRLDYVAHAAGTPQFMATNYLLFPEAAAVARTPFRTDFYALLRDARVRAVRTDFAFGAAGADEHVAALLGVAPGFALLTAEQVIYGPGGRPFDFAVIYLRPDRGMVLHHIACSFVIPPESTGRSALDDADGAP